MFIFYFISYSVNCHDWNHFHDFSWFYWSFIGFNWYCTKLHEPDTSRNSILLPKITECNQSSMDYWLPVQTKRSNHLVTGHFLFSKVHWSQMRPGLNWGQRSQKRFSDFLLLSNALIDVCKIKLLSSAAELQLSDKPRLLTGKKKTLILKLFWSKNWTELFGSIQRRILFSDYRSVVGSENLNSSSRSYDFCSRKLVITWRKFHPIAVLVHWLSLWKLCQRDFNSSTDFNS